MKYTLAFDVYGTLIDTAGVRRLLEKMLGEQAEAFMHRWRDKQLEYSFRRGLMGAYTDFSVCTQQALEFCDHALEAGLSDQQKAALMHSYTVLPAFPDAEPALRALQQNGQKNYAFSNGSRRAVEGLLNQAGLMSYFEDIISAEDIQMFKPAPQLYAHFVESTGSIKETSMLISGNAFDIIGAGHYGMQTAWIQRNAGSTFDPWNSPPDLVFRSLNALADSI